ncbi:MAG: pantoate--beta-alanine ligase [Xanthomonadales bacterium]|jgi:pantoate--beta-alanine ligase|nr:pantoate--beta-alanine ligase [Xanthomonadales bacterium]
MLILHRVADTQAQIRAWQAAGERVAVVPTMGNLHVGHLALVAEGRRRAARVVASVFVNPTQFGPNEDYARYPRTLDADCAALTAAGCDLLFAPDVAQMYPLGADLGFRVHAPSGLADTLCGVFRPGHFDGVATVVLKLFQAMPGDLAVFGEKDFQQLMVIRRMVADLLLPMEIIGLPTVREADGLALSSRNQYLSASERPTAACIYVQLQQMVADWRAGQPAAKIETAAHAALEAAGFRVDYASLRRTADLGAPSVGEADVVALIAARLGNTRLIDNLRV